jgi:hypothetical protein
MVQQLMGPHGLTYTMAIPAGKLPPTKLRNALVLPSVTTRIKVLFNGALLHVAGYSSLCVNNQQKQV